MGRDIVGERLDPPPGETSYIAHLRIEKREMRVPPTPPVRSGGYQQAMPEVKASRNISELSSITMSADNLGKLLDKLGQHLRIIGDGETIDFNSPESQELKEALDNFVPGLVKAWESMTAGFKDAMATIEDEEPKSQAVPDPEFDRDPDDEEPDAPADGVEPKKKAKKGKS